MQKMAKRSSTNTKTAIEKRQRHKKELQRGGGREKEKDETEKFNILKMKFYIHFPLEMQQVTDHDIYLQFLHIFSKRTKNGTYFMRNIKS